ALEIGRGGQEGRWGGGNRELARAFSARALCVSEIVQAIDELPIGECLPQVQLERASEDARKHPFVLTMKARIDETRKDNVVIARDCEKGGGWNGREAGQNRKPTPTPDHRNSDSHGSFVSGSGLS